MPKAIITIVMSANIILSSVMLTPPMSKYYSLSILRAVYFISKGFYRIILLYFYENSRVYFGSIDRESSKSKLHMV